tara:strand:- start:1045 stop:1392 length:348 start_codon:yes stop_codon:yes gene_type:complete
MKKRWHIGTLTTEEYPLVEAAKNERIEIEFIMWANIDSSTRTFDLHHIPSGDSGASDNFALIKGESVGSGKSSMAEIKIYLEPGDKLTTHASAVSGIVLTCYGQSHRIREERDSG